MPEETFADVLGNTILAMVEELSDAPDSLADAAYAYRLGRINGVLSAFRRMKGAFDLHCNRRANAAAGNMG